MISGNQGMQLDLGQRMLFDTLYLNLFAVHHSQIYLTTKDHLLNRCGVRFHEADFDFGKPATET